MSIQKNIRYYQHKYTKANDELIARQYVYMYVHLLCVYQGRALGRVSRGMGHNGQYLSHKIIYCDTVLRLIQICTRIKKLLKATRNEDQTIERRITTLFPRIIGHKIWRPIVRRYLRWVKLGHLFPLGRAVKESGMSLTQIARKRHVSYATVAVSLTRARIGLASLVETAHIIQRSPFQITLEYHPELKTVVQKKRYLHQTTKEYLYNMNIYRLEHHLSAVRAVFKEYLLTSQVSASILANVFKYSQMLKIPLLQCLHYIPKFQALESGSPAMALIKLFRNDSIGTKWSHFTNDYMVFLDIQQVLDLQRADDSIPKGVAIKLCRYYHAPTTYFPRINRFFSFKHQKLYHQYLKRAQDEDQDISKNDGLKLMEFCCEHGLTFTQIAHKIHLSSSRVRQLAHAHKISPYNIRRLEQAYPELHMQRGNQ